MSRIAALKNIVGEAVRGFGKAIKAQKRKARRKRLGLPEKTKLQQRSSDKVKESASKFVKRRKQLRGKK